MSKVLLICLVWISVPLLARPATSRAVLANVHGILRAMSPDRKLVAIAGYREPTVWIVSLDTADIVSEWQLPTIPGGKSIPRGLSFDNQSALRVPLVFSADSRELIVGHHDGAIECFDVQTGSSSRYRSFGHEPIAALSVRATSQNRNLLLISTRLSTGLWDYDSFYQFAVIKMEPPPVVRFLSQYGRYYFDSAIHSDGQLALVANRVEGAVHLLDLQTGEEILNADEPFFFLKNPPKIRDLHMRARFQSSQPFLSILHTSENGSYSWTMQHLASGKFRSEELGLIPASTAGGVSLAQDGEQALVLPLDHIGSSFVSFPSPCANLIAHPGKGLPKEELETGRQGAEGAVVLSDDGKRGAGLFGQWLIVWDLP